MRKPPLHKEYCFAGQPAPCPGYFANDALPCVCGVNGNTFSAMSQVAIPAIPVEQTTPYIHLLQMTA
jgi:hypothetical protein